MNFHKNISKKSDEEILILNQNILNKSKNLKPLRLEGAHFNIEDIEKFRKGYNLIRESLGECDDTIFSSDNMICWNRNYSFLRDVFYRNLFNDKELDISAKATIWRTYILVYFAKVCTNLSGDYLELGTYKGHNAHVLTRKIDFKKINKNYLLYDLFEWKDGDSHTRLNGLMDKNLYSHVCKKFEKNKNVKIVKGPVPNTLHDTIPDKIAFAHIDMNHWIPEASSLEMILPKMSLGAVIVFDDYGWFGYHQQKIALDHIADRYGQEILELPTGQGILIKR